MMSAMICFWADLTSPWPGRCIPDCLHGGQSSWRATSGARFAAVLCPVAVALAAVFLLLAQPAMAVESSRELLRDYERRSMPFGVVYYRGWAEKLRHAKDDSAIELPEYVAREISEIEGRLGRRLEHAITVVLAPTDVDFRRLARARTGGELPRWVLGIALPSQRWIIVRQPSLAGRAAGHHSGAATLRHEIAHLVVHRRPQTDVPRWFDEGVAMRLGGGGISGDDEAFLCGLARIGGLFRIDDLERRFPAEHHTNSVAYQQSFLMVEYLVQEHGESVLGRLLDGLEAGGSFASSYAGVTGRPWESFQAGFLDWMRSRRALWEVALSILNPWTLITLLALVAIVLSVWRTRRLRRRLEREEAAVDPGDGLAETLSSRPSPSPGDHL